MTKGFDWVPFYGEMSQKLLAYRDKQLVLITILKSAGVNGLMDQNPEGTTVPLTEIDPFTFLALLNKQSFVERERVLAIIKPQLGIVADVPHGFLGIPKADARQTWLFPYLYDRNHDDIDKLWDLYEEVMSGKKISEAVFGKAQEVKYTGHAKLTQAIFRAAPERFFPVDGQTTSYLAGLRLPNVFRSAREFQDICAKVKKRVSKPLYEQSHDAWFANQKKEPDAETEYQMKVLEKAAKSQRVIEGKGGVAVPKIGSSGLSKAGYQRNPTVAARALQLANFKCEIDAEHQTFISNATGTPYVEAHHLIPFSNQGGYPFSLDVTANIVALCPNCHRRLHHGKADEKVRDINFLLSEREDRLVEKRLKISKEELLKLYRGDLLEENA
ncbi:HNH endonuclease [Burkholderia cepacia]|uniref:Hnh endonuclease n=1 Tax=Burkholderia cepacia GG4 TaxID=1009846 RepID=A0A9W3PBD2_BURCE|nr:HNH endonuclease [Burkholderia cepacia]AFQ50461.1 hnh endonuclease [Burkholderia cepacia GG4]